MIVKNPFITLRYGWLVTVYLPIIVSSPPPDIDRVGSIFLIRTENKTTRMSYRQVKVNYIGEVEFERVIRSASRSGAHWDDFHLLIFKEMKDIWLEVEHNGRRYSINVS